MALDGVVGAMSVFGMGRYDLAIADYATAISLDPGMAVFSPVGARYS